MISKACVSAHFLVSFYLYIQLLFPSGDGHNVRTLWILPVPFIHFLVPNKIGNLILEKLLMDLTLQIAA